MLRWSGTEREATRTAISDLTDYAQVLDASRDRAREDGSRAVRVVTVGERVSRWQRRSPGCVGT